MFVLAVVLPVGGWVSRRFGIRLPTREERKTAACQREIEEARRAKMPGGPLRPPDPP